MFQSKINLKMIKSTYRLIFPIGTLSSVETPKTSRVLHTTNFFDTGSTKNRARHREVLVCYLQNRYCDDIAVEQEI